MKTALLFAGQATQYVGMGRHLYAMPEARAVFDAADAALGEKLSSVIFEGSKDEIDRTENTQPAVLTVACAAWAVLSKRGLAPMVLAGHSLGEYGALVAAGALDFADAVRLVRRRGVYMQEAVPEGLGAMAAVLRVDVEAIEAVCAEVEGYCAPAVFNAPKVTVISGEAGAVEAASARLADNGAMIKPLAVSAPFHCAMLAPAAEKLAVDLSDVRFGPLGLPYINNVDAAWVEAAEPDALRDALVRQVVGAVRWQETIALMLEQGVERFLHVGPGRANLGHVKRQARRAKMASVDEPGDLDALLAELDAAMSSNEEGS